MICIVKILFSQLFKKILKRFLKKVYFWFTFQKCLGTKYVAKDQVVVMDKKPALQLANSRKIHENKKQHLAAKSILKQLTKLHMTLLGAFKDNNF